MNESLAKQLHDLIVGAKLQINHEVHHQLSNLEEKTNKLIENNPKETNQNNNK